MSDHTSAKLLYSQLPRAKTLIADKGYDSDEFRDALEVKGIVACIPPTINHRQSVSFDKSSTGSAKKIDNMFGGLKDWRRISTRYDRCALLSFRPSASQQPSSSISINGS